MATSQRWLGKQAGVHGFGLLFGFGKSRLRVRVISAWMKQQWWRGEQAFEGSLRIVSNYTIGIWRLSGNIITNTTGESVAVLCLKRDDAPLHMHLNPTLHTLRPAQSPASQGSLFSWIPALNNTHSSKP